MIEFREKVRDSITGLVGIVTARAEYMNGCVQYEVTGKLIEGRITKPVWMDEQRLVVQPTVKKRNRPTTRMGRARRGGPQDTPTGQLPPESSHTEETDT